MAHDKAPAYQWYPKDYESDEDVKLMTYEQEGIYRRLLDHQALHGSIPSNPSDIAMLVPKVTLRRFLDLWPRLSRKFTETAGRLVNPKLERVKADTAAYKAGKSRNGKKGAGKRWRTDGGDDGKPIADHMADGWPATATAKEELEKADVALRESDDVLERARKFIERYPQIYAEERHGARYPVKEARDFNTFLTLVQTWPDDERLDGMFRVFLHLKGRDVLNQPGSPGQFLHHAPECDQLLRANGR